MWEAQHRHPFVTGIGDGTLDVERFKVWLRQDWLFLIEYARMLASQGDFAELVAALLPWTVRTRGAWNALRDQQPLRARLLAHGLVGRALARLRARQRAEHLGHARGEREVAVDLEAAREHSSCGSRSSAKRTPGA